MAEPDHFTVTDRAYMQLRELLTSDNVSPGDHLREVALARWLGISRTPVRAALQRLELDQLVRRSYNSGYSVAGLTTAEVSEICDVLRLVDTAMFSRASENLTEEQGIALRDCVDTMAAAAARKDLDRWSEGDQAFHELLQKASDHALFSDIAAKQRRRLHWFWTSQPGRLERLALCAEEHALIARSVADSDHKGIRRLVNEHIDHMQASLTRQLEVARPFISTNGSALDHV
ncbi:MAG TPA: GntR family transcriptional regulator [Acidimicrobiia bacterium]|nr:GntR family transcriptional regulator [Acidimicrobiia bacterium]